MPTLPIFPTEQGAPGDGSLIAVHGGSPAGTEVIGGLIHLAEAIETYPQTGLLSPQSHGRIGEPLLADGVTIWLKASLHLDIYGQPTVTDYADMLSRWNTVRDKLLLANYELFLYYHPAAPATYRKYKNVNTHLLRGYWSSPMCFCFLLAAVTTDKTLYATAAGA